MDFLVEQLVYGSFPFWDRGYDLLGHSEGCSPEIIAEVVALCRRFGQPPSADAARPAMFAARLPSGPWAVVGVRPQGLDDRGRPGALAFHALIVSAEDYGRTRSNPFGYAHRSSWSLEDAGTMPRVRCFVERITPSDRPADPSTVEPIIRALAKRRRVAVESASPIEPLAREVWASLPDRVRSRASVATWAFSGENRFDLVAFPKLLGVELDPSYLPQALPVQPETPAKPEAPTTTQPKLKPPRAFRAPGAAWVGLLGLALVGSLALAWSMTGGKPSGPPPVPSPPVALPEQPTFGPNETARVQARLATLADRFEGFEVGPSGDPARLLARIAEVLHYRGRILSRDELDQIARDPEPDKVRALAWHEQIQQFLDDRPLPGDYASTSLAEQLLAVARSFHLDPSLKAESVPDALIAALSRPSSIRPTPLAARFPALSDYARFLGRLPRSDDRPDSETGR